jgi:predicted enzyme related to lactoylglutathione lyase
MSTAAQQEVTTTPVQAGTGNFVWHELRTTDAQGAQDFYTHVLGWEAKPSGDPSGMPYTLFSAGHFTAAGMMQLTPEMLADGVPPAWVGFIGVDDVDATARRVEQAGGKLHCPPMDIPTVGRFASIEDPQGATVLLFRGNMNSAPTPPMGTPGVVGWNELSANDEKTAWGFYSSIFGWTEHSTMDMGPMGIYRMFGLSGAPTLGGMSTRDPSKSPVPFWLYYFNVEDIDAAVARVQEKNGKLLMGPHEVPGSIWIVLGVDPQGANFALVGPRK